MPTRYKYLPHAGASVCVAGLGVGVYFAFIDRMYKKDPPGSDAKDTLEPIFSKLKEWLAWLEDHMGIHHSNQPSNTPASTTPDSGVSQASFSTSHHESSMGHALAHVPVELWALIAIGLAIVAIGYHCYGNQQHKPSSPTRR